MRKLLIICLPLLLTGCLYNHTNIQGQYESTRRSCQALAESKIEYYSPHERDERSRNAELVTLFSDCMAREGWQVATPKREGGGRTSTPVGNKMGDAIMSPSQTRPIEQGQYVRSAPVRDGAVQTQATPLTPSSSMPPLRQPVPPPATVNPNASMYQPAPYGQMPAYGTGPGRSF